MNASDSRRRELEETEIVTSLSSGWETRHGEIRGPRPTLLQLVQIYDAACRTDSGVNLPVAHKFLYNLGDEQHRTTIGGYNNPADLPM
ncbi:unnamed protein product [Protopolystoma xenopodis]|uniref:Uncharacterized protein n=1 Tax=Protopolystoma xenopodis TaxID=117903 RepID=A0A448WEA4_9PLAT|nr:unnamed protein product [Protopolystoma xenopodis]